MADRPPHSPEETDANSPAPAGKEYYSVLNKLIGDAAENPALVRNLVYALARQNLTAPDSVLTSGKGAKPPADLDQAAELERAIARIETNAAHGIEAGHDNSTIAPGEEASEPIPDTADPSRDAAKDANAAQALLPVPDGWPNSGRTYLTRTPDWLNNSVTVSLDTIEYAPVERTRRAAITPFVQLIAASVLGVVLYVVVAQWSLLSRLNPMAALSKSSAVEATSAAPPPSPGQTATPPLQPQPVVPFPLPRNYGVYAASRGQLVALEQLPIRVPDARILLSAEITQPGKAVVAGDKLAFIVFRRDLANNAPTSVWVRVVAHVARSTNFVNGKPVVMPVTGSWRIRDKGYEFQVSPLETNREMVVIQPNDDFTFPAGRYALVLNGFGFDFTVSGPITAAQQCLEQMQATSGVVLSECPKS